jgi:aryl-alcohol dehydrogenase-like predicted oxidoreductase
MNNKKAITDSDAFEEVANKHGVSKYAIALAWEMKTSPTVIPIPGATRTESILDCITALDVALSDDDFEYLNANLPEPADYSSELVPKPAHR